VEEKVVKQNTMVAGEYYLTNKSDTNYPKNNRIDKSERGLHPTQKPVALLEYLIKNLY
jgi:DNA modification methylase